jgi:crotonobetaine/carnitine-CoA ligase
MERDAIGSILRRRADELPERVCCAIDEHQHTFAGMDLRADALAAGFASLGVRMGDRVATLAPNRVELLELFYGLARAGAIQVPLNAFLKGEFLRHQLSQSRASVLVTDAAGRDALAPFRGELPDLKRIVMFDEPEAGEVAYAETVLDSVSPPDVSVGPADTMSIVYTSGTTGLPKGCIASHGYYSRSADLIGSALEVDRDDVLFAGLPLYHSGGRLATVMTPLLFGVPAHLQSTFSARNYFQRAGEVGATLVIAVGAMAAAVLATEPDPADRAHVVRRVMVAPMSVAHQRAFSERFGVDPWVDVFGQTECFPVCATPLSSTLRDPAGCGRPADDLEVQLLDDNGEVVTDGGTGEICLRPREPFALFDGYYGQTKVKLESAEVAWHHTGDYGSWLESGALAFVDRKKDALRRRGENVSSLELEDAILTHSGIVEVAVHSVPSELGEDDIKACIVLVQDGVLTPEELFEHFRHNLPYYAIPRYVELVPELPRNGVGRILKHKLREVGVNPGTWDLESLGLTVARAERR